MARGLVRKTSGLLAGLAAAGLALGSTGPLSAQTVASGPQSDPCARYRHDAASHAQCAYDEAMRASIRRTKEYERDAAAARQQATAAREEAAGAREETAQLRKRTACNGELQDAIRGRPERIEIVKGLLGGRSIREADPCVLLEQLRKG